MAWAIFWARFLAMCRTICIIGAVSFLVQRPPAKSDLPSGFQRISDSIHIKVAGKPNMPFERKSRYTRSSTCDRCRIY